MLSSYVYVCHHSLVHNITIKSQIAYVCMVLESISMALIMPPRVGKRAVSFAFVRPSVRPSVAYIANNSRTQRPGMSKYGLKVPHL